MSHRTSRYVYQVGLVAVLASVCTANLQAQILAVAAASRQQSCTLQPVGPGGAASMPTSLACARARRGESVKPGETTLRPYMLAGLRDISSANHRLTYTEYGAAIGLVIGVVTGFVVEARSPTALAGNRTIRYAAVGSVVGAIAGYLAGRRDSSASGHD